MKTAVVATVALLAGWAIGTSTSKSANTPPKPPAYTIAEIDIIDPQGFQAFAKRNAEGIAAAGGLFLALQGRVVTSAGAPPKAVALIAWESLDSAVGYFNSPTFKELIPLRDQAANVRLFHVEGRMK